MSSRVASILAALMVAGAAAPARAEGGPLGLGLILGAPTGVSGKYHLDSSHAIDGALGGTFLGAGGLHVHADYLWHPWTLAREPSFDLVLTVGVGGRLLDHARRSADDDVHLGARVPFGIVFDFRKTNVPLDAFAEVVPILDFVLGDDARHEGLDFDGNAAIGARYYF